MQRLYTQLLCLLFLLIGINVSAQYYIIGTGVASNATFSYPAPFGTYNYGGRHQMMYRATELAGAGMTAGQTISEIAFEVTADVTGAFVYPAFTVSAKLTTNPDLAAGFEAMPPPLFTGNIDPAMGWTTISLGVGIT